MRWQLGGNLEPVQITCENEWRECPRAILKYLWSEIVTDVVECLAMEGIVWKVLAATAICLVLLRTLLNRKKRHSRKSLNTETLSKVGCKVQDLELKVNILTYKMQYGSWPLPHQLRDPALKRRLRNVRLTASNLNDRHGWVKRLMFSNSTPNASLKGLNNESEPKLKHKLLDAQQGSASPSECSELKSSKSSSAHSFKRSKKDPKQQRSVKKENLKRCKRNFASSSFLLDKETDKSLKGEKRKQQQRSKFSAIAKEEENKTCCEKYTETVRECKQLLKEIEEDNKNSGVVQQSSSAFSYESSDLTASKESSLHAQTTGRNDEPIGSEVTPETSDNSKGINEEQLRRLKKKLQSLDKLLRTCGMLDLFMEMKETKQEREGEEVGEGGEEEEREEEEIQVLFDKVICSLDKLKVDIENIGETRKSNKRRILDFSQKEHKDQMLQTCTSDYEQSENKSSSFSSQKTSSKDLSKSVVPMETEEDPSNFKDSDSENKSTATLLQEALQCRKELLERFYSAHEFKEEYREEDMVGGSNSNKGFQSNLLDVIAEEQQLTGSLGDRTSKTSYIFLKMKQQNEMSCHSLEDIEGEDIKERNRQSSEYFSMSNMIIRDKDNNRNIVDNFGQNEDYEKCKKLRNINELVLQSIKSMKDYTELFTQSQNNAIIETRNALKYQGDEDSRHMLETEDCVIWNQTTDSSSSESVKQQKQELQLQQQQKENLIEKLDNNSQYNQDFSLKRRPGTFSLAEETLVKWNTFFSEEQDFFSNPSFLSTTKSADINIIPASLTAKESNLLVVSRITNISEEDNKISDKVFNENNCNNMKTLTYTDDQDIKKEVQVSKETEVDSNSNVQKNEKSSKADVSQDISQQSSLYFIDSVPSSHTTINRESVEKGKQLKEEICLNKKEECIQTETMVCKVEENKISRVESRSTNTDISTKTSVSYVDACSQDCLMSEKPKTSSTLIFNSKPKKTETVIFDRNLQLLKPSSLQIVECNEKSKTAVGSSSSLKLKKNIPNDTNKPKSTLKKNTKAPFTSKVPQLKSKSNQSVTSDSEKDLTISSARSYTKQSSYQLKTRSKSNICCSRNEFFPSDMDAQKNESSEKNKEQQFKSIISRQVKPTSKSCIPVLKSRLMDNNRKTEKTPRSKSPLRSPLTMLWRDKTPISTEDVTDSMVQGEGLLNVEEKQPNEEENDKKICEQVDCIKQQNSSQERTVIYLNIVGKIESDVKIPPTTSISEESGVILPKVVTIVSSGSNETNTNRSDYSESSGVKISTGTLKSLWSVTIKQKEMEVTAKPSVADTSTSISDLQELSKSALIDKLQIFGTLDELNSAEYSLLIEALTRDADDVRLEEIQKIRGKLRLQSDESK